MSSFIPLPWLVIGVLVSPIALSIAALALGSWLLPFPLDRHARGEHSSSPKSVSKVSLNASTSSGHDLGERRRMGNR